MGISNGCVCQHLAVDFDVGLFQAMHELGVGDSTGSGGGIDAQYPDAAHVTLALSSVTIRVAQGLEHGFMCAAIEAVLTGAVPFGQPQYLVMAASGDYSTLGSRHWSSFTGMARAWLFCPCWWDQAPLSHRTDASRGQASSAGGGSCLLWSALSCRCRW